LSSTGDKDYASICNSVNYDSGVAGGIAYFTFNINPPFGNGKYDILTTVRSNRTTTSNLNLDNDITVLTPFAKTST